MVTFTRLGQLGRLGNQLFQYAALRALSLKNGYDCYIPNPLHHFWHNQKCLLGSFNILRKYYDLLPKNMELYPYVLQDYMKFDPNFFNLPDNTNIYDGFFQSTLYFKLFEDQIKKLLTPKFLYVAAASPILRKIRRLNMGYLIVSLHLRRGDNADWTNPSTLLNSTYGGGNLLIQGSFYYNYFMNAKNVFKNKKVKFLVFTGGARSNSGSSLSDVLWCKRNLVGDLYIFSEYRCKDSMVDFCLIMLCDHNIMSHISSFGWWAAYLNRNLDKTVVAPIHSHPDMPLYTYRLGYYPEGHILV